jgi:hypothetical protein
VLFAQDYRDTLSADHPAVQYGRDAEDDPVRRALIALERSADLISVLRALDISADSQLLVFSKTSIQARAVSPDNPRAIYFNDDTAVAYVPGAATIELARVDPGRGPMFYALSIESGGPPRLTRSNGCLRCHHGPNTAGVPGLYVGSVIPGPTGAPLRDDTAIITDHRTPFRDRWGGWYVTAKRGQEADRANAVALDPSAPGALAAESQQNLTSLTGRFNVSGYPAATSDIVALMTFEHQTQMVNLMTRVAWQARIAQHSSERDLLENATLRADIDGLVAYMLFSGEAPLKQPVEGVSSFTQTFPRIGPRDRRGRSLRDFDLETRLFKYPLSYLIYSAAFDALPETVRRAVYLRLHRVLTSAEGDGVFAHLGGADRRAIMEILEDTKPEFARVTRTIRR